MIYSPVSPLPSAARCKWIDKAVTVLGWFATWTRDGLNEFREPIWKLSWQAKIKELDSYVPSYDLMRPVS